MGFVHLHRHSEFSLLDGTGTADQWAKEAARQGQTALGLTDHGTLSGVLHHIKACGEAGIMPVVGVEAYYRPNRLQHDVENKKYWHLVLIAKNLKGWHSLLRITSEAYESGFYYKPCVDDELLARYSEGLICSSACVAGYLPHLMQIGQDEKGVSAYINNMRSFFGDDFYLEIMPHDFNEQRTLNADIINYANEISAPVIATVDAHYPYEDWADTQDIVLMMATGQSLAQRKKKKEAGEDVYEFKIDSLYPMGEHKVRSLFKKNHPDLHDDDIDRSISNTVNLVSTLDPFVVDRSDKLPKFRGSESADDIVGRWCIEGLERIGKTGVEEYEDRLKHELDILSQKQVLDYIYIIGDMVRWSKAQGIRVGAGRGSAAGCLVSYLCGITAVDPIAYGLLFERFINLDRKGYPDIDIDFQHDRRDEVKEYLGNKWGHKHVANIVAHQTFKARAAVQGVSRVLDIPIGEVMKVTNSIDEKGDETLVQLEAINSKIADFAKKHPVMWKHALRIEGQIKAVSMHAAGVVVTDKPVDEYMPTMRAKDGTTVTAWSDRADFPIISDYGFLKIDMLGLDELTKQAATLAMIKERTGEDIDLEALPVFSDPYAGEERVLENFRRGYNLGVLQFEGKGITRLLKSIKPTWMGDISACNALYRPGPLEGGIASAYGQIKNSKELPVYWHEAVESFLEETFGLLIYQEQIMLIAETIGNFSGGEADDLRKAIGKLYRLPGDEAQQYMNRYREQWFAGAEENDLTDEVALEIWNKILAFGDYGFNKSHSVSYSLQGYEDQWLKVHYPLEFYSSFLTSEPDKANLAIREARLQGIKLLTPNINTSNEGFTIDGDSIRFGLLAIKYLGDSGVQEVIKKRPYSSFEDFTDRIEKKKCNKRARESLLNAGAFDEFGARDQYSFSEKAELEKESIGVAISTSKIYEELQEIIDDRIDTEEEFEAMPYDHPVVCGGEIETYKIIKTKKGDDMAFLDVAHGSNQWGCTIFPDKYPHYCDIIKSKEPVLVRGNKDNRGQIIVTEIWPASRVAEETANAIT